MPAAGSRDDHHHGSPDILFDIFDNQNDIFYSIFDSIYNIFDSIYIIFDSIYNIFDSIYNIFDSIYNIFDSTYNIFDSVFNIFDSVYNIFDSTYNIFDSIYNIFDSTYNIFDSVFNIFDSVYNIFDDHQITFGSHENSCGKRYPLEVVIQRLREMQDAWTARRAEEIQGYADHNEWKNFFSVIKAVYGPPTKGTAPLLSADSSILLTEKTQILQGQAEHFRGVLNRPSAIFDATIARLPQVETKVDLDLPPPLQETIRAVQQLSGGKAPGLTQSLLRSSSTEVPN
nr:unnamed protein product [Spirometra erinaceieuropaei]